MRLVKKRMDEAEYNSLISLEHLNASLNAFSYHEPKKLPNLTSLFPSKPKPKIDRQTMKKEAAAKGIRLPGD